MALQRLESVLLATLLLSLGAHAGDGAAPEPVKLGFASPLTGPQAHYGRDSLNGAQMAIDELDARNPRIGNKTVKFELIVGDDQSDPHIGTIVAQRMVDARIHAMIGHFNSGVTIPASRIYHKAGIPQLSVSPNVKIHAAGIQDGVPVDGGRRQAGRCARHLRCEDVWL